MRRTAWGPWPCKDQRGSLTIDRMGVEPNEPVDQKRGNSDLLVRRAGRGLKSCGGKKGEGNRALRKVKGTEGNSEKKQIREGKNTSNNGKDPYMGKTKRIALALKNGKQSGAENRIAARQIEKQGN